MSWRDEGARRDTNRLSGHVAPFGSFGRLYQVDVVRTGFASDETAIQTFGLGTRHLTPHPEGTCAQEAMVDGSQQVAAGAKEILHESVHR